jgi:solute carrier family 15 (peptide/histidine transporter), member 3/4
MLALGLAINGTTSNLLVYLLKQYNVESIDAAQIANIVRGSLNLVPVVGAVASDSYFGCFPVVVAGTAATAMVGGSVFPVTLISKRTTVGTLCPATC